MVLSILFIENVQAQSVDVVLNNFKNDKQLLSSNISMLAVDIKNHDTLLQCNPDLAFATASTAKLFSTALAYEVLGADYRMTTNVYSDAKIINGVLDGNLWIHGGGDVSFGSKFFNAEGEEFNQIKAWADSLKKMGLKSIMGSIIVDGSDFGYAGTPYGWSTSDIGNYFGAFASGINIYDNVLKYYFKTGKPGTKAVLMATYPSPIGLSFTHSIVCAKISNDQSNILGEPYVLDRKGTGKLPAYKTNYIVRGSIPDPEKQMAEIIYKVFKDKGIEVIGSAQAMRLIKIKNPDYDTLYKLFSEKGRTVDEIATWTNQRSVNLFAEGLLNAVGYNVSGEGSTSSAIKVASTFWSTKIDTSGLLLYDGCGLSRNNKLSANHFCEMLTYMTHSVNYSNYLATIPIAGKTGTAKTLCDGQIGEGRIYAKSGTINGIKSYAGYINTLSGRTLAFAISVNGFHCSSSYVVSQMEKVLNALVLL